MRVLLAATVAVVLTALPATTAGAATTPVGGPLLGTRGVVAPPHAPGLPAGIDSHGWLVADADSGAVLAARDPHGKYLPASTLKTLTALTLLPELTDRQRVVVATTADVNVDGTRVGLVPNGRYPVSMLFECLLMMSGNDCANALARTAGSVPGTLARMNALAAHLGAHDTHAGTPSGLDAPGQSSSAYDLALILRADLAVPDFVRYNSSTVQRVPAQGAKYKAYAFTNDNELRRHDYPGVLAAKDGYTDAARHEFVAAAGHGGRRLIVTLMHGERYPVDMYEQAARLLNWGFAADGKVTPVGTLVRPAAPPGATPTPTAGGTSSAAPAQNAGANVGPRHHERVGVEIALGVVVVVLAAGAYSLVRRRPSP